MADPSAEHWYPTAAYLYTLHLDGPALALRLPDLHHAGEERAQRVRVQALGRVAHAGRIRPSAPPLDWAFSRRRDARDRGLAQTTARCHSSSVGSDRGTLEARQRWAGGSRA